MMCCPSNAFIGNPEIFDTDGLKLNFRYRNKSRPATEFWAELGIPRSNFSDGAPCSSKMLGD